MQHEPRNFDAFRNLSRFAESRADWKGAYAAWQKPMAIDPQTAGGTKRPEDLRRRALGEEMQAARSRSAAYPTISIAVAKISASPTITANCRNPVGEFSGR